MFSRVVRHPSGWEQMMKAGMRDFFDQQLDVVVAEAPQPVRDLLEEVTLYIEDHPEPRLLRELGLRHRRSLCGLYSGIPLTKRRATMSGLLSDAIYLYREGIIAMCRDHRGRLDARELRRQIRITLLHELGHHHGLDEQELSQLGF